MWRPLHVRAASAQHDLSPKRWRDHFREPWPQIQQSKRWWWTRRGRHSKDLTLHQSPSGLFPNLKRGSATLQHISAFTFSLPSWFLQLVLVEEVANLSCFGIIGYFLWASLMKKRINHQTMQNWSESSHQHTFWKQRYHRNQTGQFFAPLDVQAWLKNGVLSIPIIRFWESIIFSHTVSISKLHLCQPIFNRDCANSNHWSLDSSDLAAARAC